jgi:hypothetical protein
MFVAAKDKAVEYRRVDAFLGSDGVYAASPSRRRC